MGAKRRRASPIICSKKWICEGHLHRPRHPTYSVHCTGLFSEPVEHFIIIFYPGPFGPHDSSTHKMRTICPLTKCAQYVFSQNAHNMSTHKMLTICLLPKCSQYVYSQNAHNMSILTKCSQYVYSQNAHNESNHKSPQNMSLYKVSLQVQEMPYHTVCLGNT